MESLLEKEYFHFGTDNIRKELWLNLYMQTTYYNYSKPVGGLWCSKQNDYILCDWLLYIEDMSQTRHGYNYDDYVYNKKSSLIKFKNDAKLLTISNENDFKNLKDSGLIKKLEEPIRISNRFDFIYVYELPDYEKIKKIYDLLYVDTFTDKSLYQYSVDTMLAINSDAIEYYRPLKCDYIERQILSIGDKCTIADPSQDYSLLLKYLREIIISKVKQFNDNELYEIKKKLLKLTLNDKDIIKLIPYNIDKEHALRVAIMNVYNQIRDEKKLVLHN